MGQNCGVARLKTEILHTSGSTGKPKEIAVEYDRMLASARMTCDFLGLKEGDTALLCLSTRYIAGRMMEIRAAERKMRLIRREPSAHPLKDVGETVDFAAMVPLQVYETIHNATERERFARIRHVIIGGGAVDRELEDELRTFPNNIWSTYGMTETLSHVAMRRIAPATSAGNDASAYYRPLPGVRLSQDERGCLVIDAPHLNPSVLHTNDVVAFDSDGGFVVKGRTDNVICSGGIKIQIEEVEAVLHEYFGDTVMVTAKPNRKFGEVVVYLTTQMPDGHALRLAVPPYWLPKQIIHVDRLPKTETGKPDRAKAREIALQQSGKLE